MPANKIAALSDHASVDSCSRTRAVHGEGAVKEIASWRRSGAS